MPRAKLIVAHRGEHSSSHENTLPAFWSAAFCGADMIEFDVRRTKEGELVVFHDACLDGQPIAGTSLSTLRQLSTQLGFSIPLLIEVLQTTAGIVRLDVELKEVGYESEVVEMLFQSRFRVDDFAITSFLPAALAAVKQSSPGVRTGLLIEDVAPETILPTFLATGADFVAPDDSLLTTAILQDAERQRIDVMPWTVDDVSRLEVLLKNDAVIGVITNQPRVALIIRDDQRRRGYSSAE